MSLVVKGKVVVMVIINYIYRYWSECINVYVYI